MRVLSESLGAASREAVSQTSLTNSISEATRMMTTASSNSESSNSGVGQVAPGSYSSVLSLAEHGIREGKYIDEPLLPNRGSNPNDCHKDRPDSYQYR